MTTAINPAVYELTAESFNFDFSRTVPISSLVIMVLGIVLVFAVPLVMFFYVRNRFEMKPYPVLMGLICYLIGRSLVLTLADYGFQLFDMATGIFSAQPIIYYILGAFLTVLLEVLSIRIGLYFCGRRAFVVFGHTLWFAFGFLIVPLLMQAVGTLSQYLEIAMAINQGTLQSIVESMIADGSTEETIRELLEGVDNLINSSWTYYLMLVLDVILLSPVHTCLAVFIGMQSAGKIKKEKRLFLWYILALYVVIMLLRSILNFETPTVYVLLYAVLAVASCFVTDLVMKANLPEERAKFFGPPTREDDLNNKKKQQKMPKIVMPKD